MNKTPLNTVLDEKHLEKDNQTVKPKVITNSVMQLFSVNPNNIRQSKEAMDSSSEGLSDD